MTSWSHDRISQNCTVKSPGNSVLICSVYLWIVTSNCWYINGIIVNGSILTFTKPVAVQLTYSQKKTFFWFISAFYKYCVWSSWTTVYILQSNRFSKFSDHNFQKNVLPVEKATYPLLRLFQPEFYWITNCSLVQI